MVGENDGDPEGVPVGSPLGFTYVSRGGYVVMRRYVQRRYTGSLTVQYRKRKKLTLDSIEGTSEGLSLVLCCIDVYVSSMNVS